ncbi:MAG: amidohydrolase family protein, partial [Terriglobia bacterium]
MPKRVESGFGAWAFWFAVLCAVAMLAVTVGMPGRAGSLSRIVVRGGTLIDGSGSAPLQDSVVVIDGERILAVGPRSEVEVPSARVVDARGKWIIPGLIDAHVHFFQSG